MRWLMRTAMILFLGLCSLAVTGCYFLYEMPKGPPLTAAGPLEPGKSSFVMHAYESTDRVTIRVHSYRPEEWRSGDKILFVMHGAGRNAEDYLDAWIDHGEASGTLIIAPEFASRFARIATNDYQEGNLFNYFGSRNPEGEWAFVVLENIFDYLIEWNDLNRPGIPGDSVL